MTRAASIPRLRASELMEQPITQGRAEAVGESEEYPGPSPIQSEGADADDETDASPGSLRNLTAAWEDVQRTRLALQQRGIPSDGMKAIEDRLSRQIRRELMAHPIWPWLSQYPGLGGVHVARLVALIGDPHRFPGRKCESGHHHSTAVDVHVNEQAIGCGIELADGTVCTAPVGPLRRGTGTRSLWHYLGLHAVNGKSPRKTKGQRADWSPVGRTVVLMPGGIAEQIVRQRVPHYRDIYDQTKERLSRERAVVVHADAATSGPLPIETAEADTTSESESRGGLRPFQIDAIARKVAAKAFVADLLQAWKAL